MSAVAILFCSCPHPYQDARYGQQKRVHNKTTSDKYPDWRCTVCGQERDR